MAKTTKKGWSVIYLDTGAGRPGAWAVAVSAGLGLSLDAAMGVAQREADRRGVPVRVLNPAGHVIARTERHGNGSRLVVTEGDGGDALAAERREMAKRGLYPL